MYSPMNDGPETDRCPAYRNQPGPKLTPCASARASQSSPRVKRASVSAANLLIERVPVSRGGSFGPYATQTGARFAFPQSRPVRDFFAAGACALAWVLLWVLLLSAAFSPRDDVSRDRTQLPQRPGDADFCGAAMIEIDGRCILGEDVEVRAPLGWRRR
jgi:hypothetical protein